MGSQKLKKVTMATVKIKILMGPSVKFGSLISDHFLVKKN